MKHKLFEGLPAPKFQLGQKVKSLQTDTDGASNELQGFVKGLVYYPETLSYNYQAVPQQEWLYFVAVTEDEWTEPPYEEKFWESELEAINN